MEERATTRSGIVVGIVGAAVAAALHSGAAQAADAKQVEQVVKPPVAQLWVDVATMGGFGMPAGGMMGMLTGGAVKGNNQFGNTRGMSAGRWLDEAFYTQLVPAGTDATQAIPPGLKLGDSLPLKPWQPKKSAPGKGGEGENEIPPPPKFRIKFYWGCGEKVRDGQPRVLDFQTTPIEKWGEFFQGRAVRDRGAQAKPGYSLWPNEKDRRMVPDGASLVGEHKVTGNGVPANLKFQIGALHDFMPAIALKQTGEPTAVVQLAWPTVASARVLHQRDERRRRPRRRHGDDVLELGRGAGLRHGPDGLRVARERREVAQGQGAADARHDEVRDPEGHLRRRRRNASHDRVRSGIEPRGSAAPGGQVDPVGAAVGRARAHEEPADDDARHAVDGRHGHARRGRGRDRGAAGGRRAAGSAQEEAEQARLAEGNPRSLSRPGRRSRRFRRGGGVRIDFQPAAEVAKRRAAAAERDAEIERLQKSPPGDTVIAATDAVNALTGPFGR
jgi:hypothetical protein